MLRTATVEGSALAIADPKPVSTGLRLAISGGGTGGHIVPGLHLLEHLRNTSGRLDDLLWFGSGRAVEQRVLERLRGRTGSVPADVQTLALEPRGGGAPSWVTLSMRLAPSIQRARTSLRAHHTQVLLGLGGYVTAPAVLAARSLGIPVALLEINSVSGKANRFLGPLCRRVYHAWAGTVPSQGGTRHLRVGPPVSPSFQPTGGESSRRAARSCLGFDPGRPLLVVMGGSQGARALNRFVAKSGASLMQEGISVLHQVGPGKGDEAALQLGEAYRAEEFLDDVPLVLRAADLVLCRGGASTLAEVAAVRAPSWVVPYKHHSDRHQEHNARALGDGVCLIDEDDLSAALPSLMGLLGPGGARERERMRRALEGCVPTDSALVILDDLEDLARARLAAGI